MCLLRTIFSLLGYRGGLTTGLYFMGSLSEAGPSNMLFPPCKLTHEPALVPHTGRRHSVQKAKDLTLTAQHTAQTPLLFQFSRSSLHGPSADSQMNAALLVLEPRYKMDPSSAAALVQDIPTVYAIHQLVVVVMAVDAVLGGWLC